MPKGNLGGGDQPRMNVELAMLRFWEKVQRRVIEAYDKLGLKTKCNVMQFCHVLVFAHSNEARN